jgi:chlorinating enzyme
MALSASQVEQYRQYGLSHPHRLVSKEQAAALLHELQAYENSTGGPVNGKFRYKSHLVFPWISELMRDPLILEHVSDVLGPDLMVWTSHLYPKEPGDGRFISWHQDSAHWGLDSNQIITVWIALTPVTAENGCMRMLKGSHHRGQVAHEDTWDKDNMLTRGQKISAAIDESQAVWVELQAGEASLHHVDMWHASKPNESSARRVGLALRYITPKARQTRVAKDYATQVAGEDAFGHFELEPRCERLMDPKMIELHEHIANVQGSIYLEGTDRADAGGLVETNVLNQ